MTQPSRPDHKAEALRLSEESRSAPSHQDSTKVPEGGWPPLLHVVEIGPGSTPPDFRASAEDTWLPELAKRAYISVSALLSDEAKAAAHRAFVGYWAGKGTWSTNPLPPGTQQMEAMQAALQAAIEQVGGGQGE